jgi:hypothetical protein
MTYLSTYWYHPETGERIFVGSYVTEQERNLVRGEKDIEYYSKDNNKRFLPKGIILRENKSFNVRADIPINMLSREPETRTITFGSFRSLKEAKEHKQKVIKALLSDF